MNINLDLGLKLSNCSPANNARPGIRIGIEEAVVSYIELAGSDAEVGLEKTSAPQPTRHQHQERTEDSRLMQQSEAIQEPETEQDQHY